MSSKVIVTIFGASGDLAKRKLYPSLFRLYKSGKSIWKLCGYRNSPQTMEQEYFESVVVESITDLADSPQQAQNSLVISTTKATMSMIPNITSPCVITKQLGWKYQTEHNKVFFLSMAPQFFGTIAKHLKSEECGWYKVLSAGSLKTFLVQT